MTFLQPWAVWFLAGIPIIVLLYLLRLKRRDLTVSTHLFWQRVLQESSRRAFFHRLRHLFSLLLQILIFLLIAGALARPLWKQDAEVTTNTVIVLDTRARMQALEPDGESRFAKATAAARNLLRQANARARVALITSDHSARIVTPFTDDERALRDGLEKARVTDAGGDISKGVELAQAILAGRPGRGQVIVLTDRPLPSPPAGEPQVITQTFGTERDNAAITRFAARPHPANRETVEVLLEVQNFGRAPLQSEVELALDGRPFEVRKINLAPGQSSTDVFASVPRPGRGSRGWLTARLQSTDALATDNAAFAAHPARSPRRVLLVSAGNTFLETLLSVDPATKFQFIAPDAWQPALAEKFETVIFDRIIPAGFDFKSARGNLLFLGANPFGPPADPLPRPLITEVSADHPITRNVALRNIMIEEARPLRAPEASGWSFRAPLQSFDQPLLVAGENGRRRIVAIGFDLLQSDLPLRIAFPLLISNVLQWLDPRDVDAPLALLAGETLSLRPGQRVSTAPVTPPAKDLPQTIATPLLEPARNGFYLLAEGDEQRWIAVNTFDPAESDLRGLEPPATSSASASVAPALGPWPLWTWLTLAALGLFTGEWWLFHRRKTE